MMAIMFLLGMMSAVKGYVKATKENPRQYYELKRIPSEYEKDIERIRSENGL
jgi:hypothetical protein